ncbi:MAG: hypothetical protein LUB83_03090 [Prevotellaceae bacterium]|nr:hypothetical protein [Prevotellaceae bacterium]
MGNRLLNARLQRLGYMRHAVWVMQRTPLGLSAGRFQQVDGLALSSAFIRFNNLYEGASRQKAASNAVEMVLKPYLCGVGPVLVPI